MHKQCVFLVNTGADGSATVLSPVDLNGTFKSIEYITDRRVPYDAGAKIAFGGEGRETPMLEVEATGRDTWTPEGELKNEKLQVTITGGGKGKSGSFLVTMN